MSYERLGEHIARWQDAALRDRDAVANDIAAVRRRLFDERAQEAPSRPIRRTAPLAWAAAAALTLIAWGGYVLYTTHRGVPSRAPDAVAHHTPAAAKAAPAASWHTNAGPDIQHLSFADGSTVSLHPGARIRVLRAASQRVALTVEGGTIDVHVRHHRNTAWTIEAGPYEVRVTGTRFTVSWASAEQHFALEMRQGSVWVTGPMLDAGRMVHGTERISAALAQGRLEIDTAPEDDAAGYDSAPRPSQPAPRPHSPAQRGRRAAPPAEPATSWVAYNRNGAFHKVLEEAASMETRRLTHLPVSELMALADAARLTGDFDQAASTYRLVRQHHGDHPLAVRAAFDLGRMAFDQQKAYGVAAKWLTAYLREAPDGAFAKEALGRLLEAQVRMGRMDMAKATARTYIDRFPSGPHAAYARSLLATP